MPKLPVETLDKLLHGSKRKPEQATSFWPDQVGQQILYSLKKEIKFSLKEGSIIQILYDFSRTMSNIQLKIIRHTRKQQ